MLCAHFVDHLSVGDSSKDHRDGSIAEVVHIAVQE